MRLLLNAPDQPDTAIAARRDQSSLWMRAVYFFHYAGIGAYSPYLTLYYRTLGLSGPDIGVLAAIQPLATAVLAPLWGLVADRWEAHRLLLRVAVLCAAVVALLMMGATSFWQFLPLITLLAFFISPTPSLIDGYGVTISERRGVGFGVIRIWGSIGYIFATWAGGWLMGQTISPWFLLAYAVALVLLAASSLGLPRLNLRSSANVWSGAATIVRQPPMIVLLVTFFLISCGTSPSYSFFGIYLTEMGGDVSLVGIASGLSAVSELPIMVLGGWLLTRLGARRMLTMSLAFYILRFVLYTLVPGPLWVLPVQMLHGLTFGLYLMSSVTLMHETLGKHFAATAQGLLSSTFSFGQITGSLVGGILLDRYGIITIFRISSVIIAVALVFLVVGTRLVGDRVHLPATVEP